VRTGADGVDGQGDGEQIGPAGLAELEGGDGRARGAKRDGLRPEYCGWP